MSEAESTPRCVLCQAPLTEGLLECPRCLWSELDGGSRRFAAGLVPTLSLEESGGQSDPAGAGHPLIGQTIGGCVLEERLGHGGMGVVWRARQLAPVREVALKMMKANAAHAGEFRARFELEARALAVLEHPGILPLYDYGEDDGCAWFTMKLAAGGTMALRREEFAGKWRRIGEMIRSLALALQYAHDHGVLHRDLKPGNILFDAADQPCIADFGLAKLTGEASVLDGSLAVLGTPAYLAPEVAAADARAATTASDIYGLGATLYELLAGAPPYAAKSLHTMLREITSTDPVPPSRRADSREPGALPVPRDLEIICMKCLAREPARRYVSARALADDLDRWLSGRPISARHASLAERSWALARRNPAVAGLAAALFMALFTGGIVLYFKNRELRGALKESSAAREDAEQRIEFMTRSLGDKMRSYGQLTLLNEVFDDVARYYAARPASADDAVAVERRINFHVRAGEMLVPQGKVDDALRQFNEAIALAKDAAARFPDEEKFRVLLVESHQLTGLALLDFNRDAAVMEILQRGIAQVARPATAAERAARAGILSIAARTAAHLEDWPTAINLADEAVALRRALLRDASGAAQQTALALALEARGIVLKENADDVKDGDPAQAAELFLESLAAFTEMRDLLVEAVKAAPEFLPWQRSLASSHNWMAAVQRRQGNYEEAKKNLAEQRRFMEPLLSAEPLNGEWQMAMVLNAWQETYIARKLGAQDEQRRWNETQVELSTRLMNQNPSVRMWWGHHRDALRDLGRAARDRQDSAAAGEAFAKAAEAALRANQLTASPGELEDMAGLMEDSIDEIFAAGDSAGAAARAENFAVRMEAHAAKLPAEDQAVWQHCAERVRLRAELLRASQNGPTDALAVYRKGLSLPGGLEYIPAEVREEARSDFRRVLKAGTPDKALAAAEQWMSFTDALAAAPVSEGWRAGWFRLAGTVVSEVQEAHPGALPAAKAFARTALDRLKAATPHLPLTEEEAKAAARVEALVNP
jgi:tetratricopeptide (TPR) repeat protein